MKLSRPSRLQSRRAGPRITNRRVPEFSSPNGSRLRECQAGEDWASPAFTLPEMMIALTILTMVLAGILSSHLFGVRMVEITKAKLGASDEARRALGRLTAEIRSAKRIQIGNGSSSSFTEIEDGEPQKGNAIQVYPSTNYTQYLRYYLDAAGQQLKRVNQSGGGAAIIANSVTNQLVFTSEDFAGNVITNNQNNRVIGVHLEFYQIQYPIILIGPGHYYDYYQLRTRVTRRALE